MVLSMVLPLSSSILPYPILNPPFQIMLPFPLVVVNVLKQTFKYLMLADCPIGPFQY